MIPGQLIPVKTEELFPFVRFAREQIVGADFGYNHIVAYDSRAVYITEGNGILRINDKDYVIKKGTFAVWPPGLVYSFFRKSNCIKMMLLNFDCQNKANIPDASLLHPDPPEYFQSERIIGMTYLSECTDENGVLILQNAHWAESMMRELIVEYTRHMVLGDTISKGILIQLLTKLVRNLYIGAGKRSDRADEIIAYLNEHLNEKLTYEKLAKVFNYHPGHMNRLITRSTGMSIHQYLMRIRLEHAYSLLDNGLSVAETAEKCGFADAISFSKAFHRKMGVAPSAVKAKDYC